MRMALTMLGYCLILLGCHTDGPKSTLIHDKNPTKTREEIFKLVPLGTPLSQGEAILMINGFTKVEDPSKWPEPQPGTAPRPGGEMAEYSPYVTYVIHNPIDLFVSRDWYVQLYHEAGVVEDIRVAAGGLTGP